MADLITAADFALRTNRTLSGAETLQVEALITDASALVADIVNDPTITDTWVGVAVPASVVPVVVRMVKRALDNPDGYSSQSIGSYSHAGAATEGIFAKREEARAIRQAAGLSGVGSLHLDGYLGGRTSWLDGAL